MPPLRTRSPQSLEAMCITEINQHLIRELHVCYQVRRYQDSSLLLRRRGINSEELHSDLDGFLDKLPPLLSEAVRQQLLTRLMKNYPPKRPKFVRNTRSDVDPSVMLVVDHRLVLEMLEIILNHMVKSFEFFHNSFKSDSTIWNMILTHCTGLRCFKLVPNMFTKPDCSTHIYPFINQLTVNCPMLTELVLKDVISNYEPLMTIGKNCHHLKKLDLSGSQVDCRDIFSLCVSSVQDSLLVPYDFYIGMDDRMFVKQTDCNPLCQTMESLILCNTNVRSRGVGLVLRLMPNLQTLGSLVYTAAGMKNLYNLVRSKRCAPLKLKEVYYRGPSHIKLKLLSCCCPLLELLSLGSTPVRRIQEQLSCTPFKNMHTLILENIHPQDIKLALRLTPNLLRLELECINVDISVIAINCPKLRYLVIKREPIRDHTPLPPNSFSELELIHLATPVSLMVAGLFFTHSKKLKVIEMVRVRDLNDQVFYSWLKANPLPELEVLILRFVALTRVSINLILRTCPNLCKLGEIGGWDVRSWECRRIKKSIVSRNYDLEIIVYSTSSGSIIDVFNDALSSTDFISNSDEDQ